MPHPSELNRRVFDDPLTQEAAYWIGFLKADGCISNRYGNPILSVGLKGSDSGHLEKLVKFLGSNVKIYHSCPSTTFGQFSVARMQTRTYGLEVRLREFGIVPRKTTMELGIPESLSRNRDFWRGMVDGDGSICSYPSGYLKVALCGSKPVMEGFISYVSSLVDFRFKICSHGSIFSSVVGGKRARLLLSEIYYKDSVSLERKYQIARNAIN